MTGKLIIINIKALFAGMFKRSRSGKKRGPILIIAFVLLAVYVFGAMFFTFGAMFYNLCAALFNAGVGWFYFALAGMMIFGLCFLGSFFMVQTQLFNARDNELLLSMPLKPSAILAGRLAALLVFEYLFESLVLLPVIAVLIITGFISVLPVLGIVFFLLSALLLPLFALAAGCLLGWLVALVTSRMRNKNMTTFILSIVFLGVYFFFYSKMNEYMRVLIENGAEIAEAMRRAVFPAYHFGLAAAEGRPLSFFIFAVCAGAPFAVMYTLLSISFIKVATSNRGAKKLQYREKTLHASGISTALLKKELRRFASNPMYILNTALGAMTTLILAVFIVIKPRFFTDFMTQITSAFPVSQGFLIIAALTMLSGTNFISAPSISLEGKTLWIIKSLPVRSRDIILSKAHMHIAAAGIPAALSGLICIFALPADSALQALLMILTPLSLTVLMALLGVTLNLIFPRFDWMNEIQPIKQGISCMLTMFAGMALVTTLALLYALFLKSVFTPDVYLVLCTALFILLSALFYFYINGSGVRRFERLDV